MLLSRGLTKLIRGLIPLVALAVAILIILGSGIPSPYPRPVAAQSVRFQETAKQLYQRLPNFPLENQYISKVTGKVATENTLARRLIQYHIYIKGRPAIYRLDWKLTLADYLGVNEPLMASTYPSHNLLRSNPMPGDRAAISRLNRSQRDALVQTLVEVFTANAQEASPASRSPSPAIQPSRPSPQLLPLPKSGDAELLSP